MDSCAARRGQAREIAAKYSLDEAVLRNLAFKRWLGII